MTDRRRIRWGMTALLTAFCMLLILAAGLRTAYAATYRQGSSGEAVRTIQTKLQRWGYYDGEVDGVYGSSTAEAVKWFQQANGLTADGVAGPATLRALGMETEADAGGGTQTGSGDFALLARVISAEARGEPPWARRRQF